MATKKATGRKPNRKAKRAGRRRRKNTTSASVSAPRSTANKRVANRARKHKTTRRRRRNTGGTSMTRRLRNGASAATGWLIAGAGIIGFDMVAQKLLGAQSAPIGAVTKIGGGYLLANSGKKLPFVGQHAELIGAVLIVNGVVDLYRMYVLPKVLPYLPVALLPAPAPVANATANGNGMQGLVNMYNRPGFGAPGFGGLVSTPNGPVRQAFV